MNNGISIIIGSSLAEIDKLAECVNVEVTVPFSELIDHLWKKDIVFHLVLDDRSKARAFVKVICPAKAIIGIDDKEPEIIGWHRERLMTMIHSTDKKPDERVALERPDDDYDAFADIGYSRK